MNRDRFASALAMVAMAAILLPSSLTAQITFQRTYGGAHYDRAQSVRQTADGGYIIAGFTWSYGAGSADFYVVKTDSGGNEVWTRTYGGPEFDGAAAVLQDFDCGYVIAGDISSGGVNDIYLVKTDANGDSLWAMTYGGPGADICYSAQQTFDSGFVLAGYTTSFGSGQQQVYVIKTDADGDTLWTSTYAGIRGADARSIGQTADSGYIIAGNMDDDAFIIKTDARGVMQWIRTYGGGEPDYARSVQQTADGGYILTGSTYSFGAGEHDVYLVKTRADGDTLWTRTFGDADQDYGWSVVQTIDGGYVIASTTAPWGPGYDDIILIKTDSCGDTCWTRTLGGDSEDLAYAVQQTVDGGYVLAGSTTSFGAWMANFYLIKTDSLGNVGVAEPKTSPTRAKALSLSCEPNPCAGTATIRLSPTAYSHAPMTLRVYDSQGRQVHSVLDIRAPSIPLDLRDLPSGAYFARAAAGGEHATARVVLQR